MLPSVFVIVMQMSYLHKPHAWLHDCCSKQPHLLELTSTATGPVALATTIRLVNGSNPYTGRVEVLHSGDWLAVLTQVGDTAESRVARSQAAIVACRQLGWSDAMPVIEHPAAFGNTSLELQMNVSSCATGEVNDLFACMCSMDVWGRISTYGCMNRSPGRPFMSRDLYKRQLTVSCPAPRGERARLFT